MPYSLLSLPISVLLAFAPSLVAQGSDAAKRAPTQNAAQDKTGKSKPMSWTGVLDEKTFAALHELKKGEAPELHGEMIRIGDDRAYLSLPKKWPQPGSECSAVLVIHEWWGLNDNVKHWADRLAADGHAALAVDLYGGVVATTRDEAMSSMRSVEADVATKTLLAAHEFLAKDPRVLAKRRACVGWCFGGGWSLKLAMAAPDLDAAVIYYGRLIDDPEVLAKIRAKVLGVFGNRDSGIPPKSVDAFEKAMKKAKKSIEILRYDADHAFANPSSARYDATNAAAAWKRVRAFLHENLRVASTRPSFAFGARRFTYTMPQGWSVKPPRAMRNLDLAVDDALQCYVTVLPGAAGGVGPNVNRWRMQLGQDVVDDAEIEKLPRFDMLGARAVSVSIDGSFKRRDGSKVENGRMMAVICPLDDAVVFVKMIGPRKVVDAHASKFTAFCRSMR